MQRLAGQAARQNSLQELTLLRFSKSGLGGASTEPDFSRQAINEDLLEQLGELCAALQPSESDAGPEQAVAALKGILPGEAEDQEERRVYLVSDFRATQWQTPGELKQTLQRLTDRGAELDLVQCVETVQPNLAIAALEPAAGTRAVGISIPIRVSVTNFGTETARNVPIELQEDGRKRASVAIESIAPGATVTQGFEVRFQSPGYHRLQAELPGDVLPSDNRAYCAFDVPLASPVLVIDGSRDPQNDASFLTAALAPDPKSPTGIEPLQETPQYLGAKPLDSFSAVYLLNVDRLGDSAIAALEDYVKRGGGLAIFMGPNSRVDFINQSLYRGGEGLFPLPVVAATELLADRAQRSPDLELAEHPVFARFKGEQNSDIDSVRISRYVAAVKTWRPPAGSTVKVLARLRNGAPLAVEQTFGEGVVVAFLTSAGAHEWNSWARQNYSYVVTMLELQAYLSAASREQDVLRVDRPLTVTMNPERFLPTVRFVSPDTAETVSVQEAKPDGKGQLSATLADTHAPGFYEASLQSTAGQVSSRLWAVNVSPDEGNLNLVSEEQLRQALAGVPYRKQSAAQVAYASGQGQSPHMGQTLLLFFVAILVIEQVVAYSSSYHARPSRAPLLAR